MEQVTNSHKHNGGYVSHQLKNGERQFYCLKQNVQETETYYIISCAVKNLTNISCEQQWKNKFPYDFASFVRIFDRTRFVLFCLEDFR
jgi:hypothetical protein